MVKNPDILASSSIQAKIPIDYRVCVLSWRKYITQRHCSMAFLTSGVFESSATIISILFCKMKLSSLKKLILEKISTWLNVGTTTVKRGAEL